MCVSQIGERSKTRVVRDASWKESIALHHPPHHMGGWGLRARTTLPSRLHGLTMTQTTPEARWYYHDSPGYSRSFLNAPLAHTEGRADML